MLELLKQPWPWYIAGVLIGLTVPALLLIGNKSFGISSSLRHICAACFPANISFFKYDWKKEAWNLFFVGGVAIGGIIATYLLTNPNPIIIAESTKQALAANNVKDFEHLLPTDIFSWSSLLTLRGFIFMVVGGFLVGFGVAVKLSINDSVVYSIPTIITPLPVFAYTAIVTLVPRIRGNKKKITNQAFIKDDSYLIGYERIARKKKFFSALSGGIAGILAASLVNIVVFHEKIQ